MPPAAGSGARKGQSGAGAARRGGVDGAGQQRKGGSARGEGQKAGGRDGQRALQDPDAEDTNAGFGKYLRSQEGIDMMKLFVIANTIVVFMTMAWPQMQQSYQILRSLIFAEDADDEL
ncbi:AGAP013043-PA-like protein [Anopheles sinensis]|uniref:AGAP013043-PA-like protein n=1 Tax=Anopheles sinensis TaxID=74873 RepID=A0A084VVH1_ANOSI|nr:AGAP013043-PA-like protein [Anopheles sinensis]